MSRLTFEDLTPDDMPAPYVDDSGDRADAFRDSLLDCGKQTNEGLNMKSSKWINSAARRRNQLKYRRHLCRILGCPIDSCYTTGELRRDAYRERGAK